MQIAVRTFYEMSTLVTSLLNRFRVEYSSLNQYIILTGAVSQDSKVNKQDTNISHIIGSLGTSASLLQLYEDFPALSGCF